MGSDETFAGKVIDDSVEDAGDPARMFLKSKCYRHQTQILVKLILSRLPRSLSLPSHSIISTCLLTRYQKLELGIGL